MTAKYEFLKPVVLAEKCFLAEALYWCAFGRVPDEEGNPAEPYRFSDLAMEDHIAPIPFGLELSDGECRYADIPPDPRMAALLAEEYFEETETLIERRIAWRTLDDFEFDEDKLEAEIQAAFKYHAEVERWLPEYDAYLDQFRNQICLDLRHGKITAFGYRLPKATFQESHDYFEANSWPTAREREEIPSKAWLSKDINWDESALYGTAGSFIWIYMDVSELLEKYPPNSLIKNDKALRVGSMVAVASDALNFGSQTGGVRRGRPPLPWAAFHVEVARLYRDGKMPKKKEAAIAMMQDWFIRTQSRPASRSSIGEKLKPYFDALGD